MSVYATSARPVNAPSAHVSCMADYSLFQAIIPSLLLVVANSDTAHDASKHLSDHLTRSKLCCVFSCCESQCLTLLGVHSCMSVGIAKMRVRESAKRATPKVQLVVDMVIAGTMCHRQGVTFIHACHVCIKM